MAKTHIGKKIKEVFKKTGNTVAEFGEQINMSRDGVNKVFAKAVLDTELLRKISKALNHDFFVYFSDELDLAREPKGNFGFATKDDLNDIIYLLKKLDARIDQLEEKQHKKKSSEKKGKLKLKKS